MSDEVVTSLLHDNGSKILLLVLDGLGGLPDPDTGRTELETASTPAGESSRGNGTAKDDIASKRSSHPADPPSPRGPASSRAIVGSRETAAFTIPRLVWSSGTVVVAS